MWIKDKVNDCYKMSHSHLITIEKVNRHYILYFRDRMIKSFPTLTAAKQYGDFFQLDSHTRYAIYLIHNFGNCTGNNLGYYTGTIGLQGDIYMYRDTFQQSMEKLSFIKRLQGRNKAHRRYITSAAM